MIERRPNAVSKATIHDRLWPDTFVAEVNLPVLIHRLREALEDDPRDPRYVRTVTRFGYAFCGSVWTEGAASTLYEYRVVFGSKEIQLRAGDNILGRTFDAAVRIDQTSVSRRHAVIRVTEAGALIEDCGSKNGTFVGNERVNGPVQLKGGDRILLGAAMLMFHCFRRESAGGEDDTTSRPTTPLVVGPEGQILS